VEIKFLSKKMREEKKWRLRRKRNGELLGWELGVGGGERKREREKKKN